MVRGRLIGSVRALKVILQSTAQVEGNLVHKISPLNMARILRASCVLKNPLAYTPEVPRVEPQRNHDGHSETVNQRERGNGFIKSLPELLSA